MKQHKWLRLIDDFNDNEHDFIIDNFGDVQSFFETLKSKDLFHLIDPEANGSEYWVNEYLIYLSKDHRETFFNYILSYLDDVELKDGKFYYVSRNREDIAYVFCDNSRRQSDFDIAQRVLDADADFYEAIDRTTDDVYEDVIKELSPKNLQKLKELIVYELKDVNVKPNTELLENISQEQNHPEYVVVDQSNVSTIVDDEETMNYILNEHLTDMRSNLYQVHHTSYNDAYFDDLWEEVWSELQTYFVGQGSFVQKPTSTKSPEKTAEYFEIEIANFESNILEYLNNNKGYGNSGTLSYQGSYINVLKEDFDCLSFRTPDYPDFRKVDKNINELFNDYL